MKQSIALASVMAAAFTFASVAQANPTPQNDGVAIAKQQQAKSEAIYKCSAGVNAAKAHERADTNVIAGAARLGSRFGGLGSVGALIISAGKSEANGNTNADAIQKRSDCRDTANGATSQPAAIAPETAQAEPNALDRMRNRFGLGQ